MRVMHVITGLGTGGAEMMLFRLLSSSSGEFEPLVVSLIREGPIAPRIRELGIPVYSLGLRPGVPDLVRALPILRWTRQFRPHLIQGWMYHGNLLASIAVMGARGKIPVLWNVRGSLHDISNEKRRTTVTIKLGARLSRYPEAIVYNSETAAHQHEELGYRAERRVVIPNGIDCQVFRADDTVRRKVRAKLGIDDEAVVVGFVARYHPVKDHPGFLRAAALVARVHPQVHFLLAGRGVVPAEPALADAVAEMQLHGRVHLLGERADIPQLTAALDIACSASRSEGFPNAVAEAMACCVPCVVTDVGASRHIVGDSGVWVPARDAEALAKGLSRLISAGAERRRCLGVAARQRIEAEFSLPMVANRYRDLYYRVAPNGNSGVGRYNKLGDCD